MRLETRDSRLETKDYQGVFLRILAPQTAEEAAEIFRQASRERWKLCIRGAGSQRAVIPERTIISTQNLQIINPGHPGDLTITLGAGALFRQLREFLPAQVILPDYDGTIGGCLCGDRRTEAHRFLMPRTLALTFVRSNGDIVKLGCKAVNVAGFKIIPFFGGSKGRLGLVTEVTINTAPVFRDVSIRQLPEGYRENRNAHALRERLISAFDGEGTLS